MNYPTYDTTFKSYLARQVEFSAEAFGPGDRHEAILDHVRKELVEIEKSGGALDEWVDLVILALDGAWRRAVANGERVSDVIDEIEVKLEINRRRTWPDWRTADPDKAIEHVRSEA